MAQGSPLPGEKYLHFKNRLYQVIAVAYHSETMEKLVVYQALYGDYKIYVRPYDMFISEVDHEKYPEVKQRYRFLYIADAADEETLIDNAQAVRKEEQVSKQMRENDGQASGTADVTGQETGVRTSSGESGETMQKPEKVLRVLRAEDVAGRYAAASDAESDGEEERLNPWLEKFLDAENFEGQYKVVCDMQREVTDRLIDDIAVVMDLAIPDGDLKERYAQLLYCMRTRQRYEQGRLR